MAIGKLPDSGAGEFDESGEAIFAEINITPLTDLFLVMLIIFMVSASVAVDKAEQQREEIASKAEIEKRSGIKINLPSGASREIDLSANSVVVSIATNGDIAVRTKTGDQKIASADLDKVFQSAFAQSKETQVVIKADKGVHHGSVVAVMERAKRVGLSRLAIATQGGGN